MKFPAKALTPSQPRVRGIYALDMSSWSVSLTVMRALERLSFGKYLWPKRAVND